jgi:hypothetical protein
MVMANQIRWADRDAGQKFSLLMFGLLAIAGMLLGLFVGMKLLMTGPETINRLFGAGLLANLAFLLFKAVRRWGSRHAR